MISIDWVAVGAVGTALGAFAGLIMAVQAWKTLRREAARAAGEQRTARRAQDFREMVRVYETVDRAVSRFLGRLRRWQTLGPVAAAWRIHEVNDEIQHSVHLLTLHRAPEDTISALRDVADGVAAVVSSRSAVSRVDGLLKLFGRDKPRAEELAHLESLHVRFLRTAQEHLEEIWPRR